MGSTSVVAAPNGGLRARTLYKPWGEVRYQSGTLPTEYTFTGQYSHVDDFGLLYYNARWYDPALGRFVQADTVVPGAGSPSAWDRYAYTQNNPLKYSDPTGHWPDFSWNINTAVITQKFVNAAVNTVGLSGVTSAEVATTLSTIGTALDVAAEATDVVSVTAVAAITAIGAPMATPAIAYAAGEATVKPLLFVGNVLATVATVATAGSELISGDLGLDLSIQSAGGNLSVSGELAIGTGTAVGAVTTGLGWIPGVPSWGSLALQTAAVANDFGVGQQLGWLDGTSYKVPIQYSSNKPSNKIYLPLIQHE